MKKIFVVILCFFFLFMIPVVKADSGFDNYGGYSGSSGGYSYDSDYGSSYSGSSGSSGSHSSRSASPLNFTAYVASMIAAIISSSKRRKDRNTQAVFNNEVEQKILENTRNITPTSEHTVNKNYDSVIKKYLPSYTEQKLLEEFYNIFVSVQEAWMEFDYDQLEKYCSNALYESYKVDLNLLGKKNQKNIMSDFSLISSNIRGIEEQYGRVRVDVYLYVSFKDYIINEESGEVVDGNAEQIQKVKYDLEYTLDLDGMGICPNCGAELKENECEFCHSVVDRRKDKFVLNKKSVIGRK